MDSGEHNPRTCPSSPLHKRANVLGLVRRSGRVHFLGEPLPVHEEFIQIAGKGRSVGQRFRFSGPCLKSGCGQWRDGSCSVAAETMSRAQPEASTSEHPELPECGIRTTCRWFAQEGATICRACPEVLYDGTFVPTSDGDGEEEDRAVSG